MSDRNTRAKAVHHQKTEKLGNEDNFVRIKFISDNDVVQLLYEDGARKKRIGSTPQHNRVAALQRGSPGSPSSKRLRTSARLSSSQGTNLACIDESDAEEECHTPLKPRSLFPEPSSEDLPVFAGTPTTRKQKGQMMKLALESAFKNSPSRNSGTLTPTKSSSSPSLKQETTPNSKRAKLNNETPKSSRGRPRNTPTPDMTPKSKLRQPKAKEQTPQTPKQTKVPEAEAKTPYALRRIVKKHIESVLEELDSDWEEDESDSELEFQSSSSEDEISTRVSPEPSTSRASSQSKKQPAVDSPAQSRASRKLPGSMYTADDYFSRHASAKVVTSDRTLNKLQNPRLKADKVQEVLQALKDTHLKEN